MSEKTATLFERAREERIRAMVCAKCKETIHTCEYPDGDDAYCLWNDQFMAEIKNAFEGMRQDTCRNCALRKAIRDACA